MKCGIIGLSNIGKSTIFNILTNSSAPAKNYPFCTINPNKKLVYFYDKRINIINNVTNSYKVQLSSIEIVDIAGLIKGASLGNGLGNKFLNNIRNVDIILHVVRCFENDSIVRLEGKLDPLSDIKLINNELILCDIQNIENILLNKKIDLFKKNILNKIKMILEKERFISDISFTMEEQKIVNEYNFLTNKPYIYLANVNQDYNKSKKYINVLNSENHIKNNLFIFCAKDNNNINDKKRDLFGIFLKLLDNIIFFTVGKKEIRSCMIRKNTFVKEAARKIHSDIKKGFISAEILSFNNFLKYKNFSYAKSKGKTTIVGKKYIVQDGDIIIFRFSL